jgi:hypothetical protein
MSDYYIITCENLQNTEKAIYNYMYYVLTYQAETATNKPGILLKILEILESNRNSLNRIQTDKEERYNKIDIQCGPLKDQKKDFDGIDSFLSATIECTLPDEFRLYLLRLLYFTYNMEKYRTDEDMPQRRTYHPNENRICKSDYDLMYKTYQKTISKRSENKFTDIMFANFFTINYPTK